MDNSNQKWQFHVVAWINRTFSVEVPIKVIHNSEGKSKPAEDERQINQNQG
jgi:hypothetical protein